MIGVVLALGFLLLLVALQAPLIAALGVLTNLLATGAAFGIARLIFQNGHGAGLLGFESQGFLDAWGPVFFFAMIFAISMDYTVFLLSSAKEHCDRSGDPREALIGGLAHSGRVIFAAAAVMVAVFFTFALSGPLPPKEMGVILGIAVLLDAMLVRLILIPTLLRVFGRHAWALPRWLDRSSPTSASATPDARPAKTIWRYRTDVAPLAPRTHLVRARRDDDPARRCPRRHRQRVVPTPCRLRRPQPMAVRRRRRLSRLAPDRSPHPPRARLVSPLMYELWQTEWCPASRRVRQRLTELGIDYLTRQVPVEREDRVLLRERTGGETIPALVTPDGALITGESAILAHLEAHEPTPAEARAHRLKAEKARRRYLEEECECSQPATR